MIRWVVGVDPGSHAAAAAVTVDVNPRLLLVRSWPCSKIVALNTPSAVIADLLRQVALIESADPLPHHANIETQYVDKNVQSTIKLAHSAGRWQEACATHGIDVEFVQPSAWQSRELGRGLRSEALKLAARRKAGALWNVALDEHQADAALIARHAAITLWNQIGPARLKGL